MENFDNDQDALRMIILFFIHTFLLSETDDAAVSYIEFNMVEDGRYKQYPWEKIAFNKLMNSLRQDFFVEKPLYRLGGMPHVLNIWMYECCSEVDKDISCRIDNRIPRICYWFVVETKPKFRKFMNGMFSKYLYTNISPTVDELKGLQLSNHDGMDLKDSVNSTLSSTSCRQTIKVDQKAKMTAGQSPSLIYHWHHLQKRRKTDAKQKESVTDQEKIKGQPSVEEVNQSPSGTSNTIIDPIIEEAPHKPSLKNFGERTLPAEQNPPVVESGRESTQKINVSGETYHEQVLMKVDMNTIESLVKKYVVIEIDSSNKDVEKKDTHGDDLKTPKEHPKDVPEKENEMEVKNIAFQHSVDNTIAEFFSPVSAIQSEELLQKENLPDLILPTNNIEDRNELQESTNDSSIDVSQESIDNIITGISTSVVAMKMKSVSPTKINDNECQIHDTQFQSILPEAEMGKQHTIKTRTPRNRK
ncbi:uncharacterized protein LOC107876749 [Capsicum annuum]|uniref:uncharacterized protein LOC107876749 n=1 Tax=Capsicum annuum TaxID=4072 RepID=UPI001FB0AF21|nr:uncharacterized protein LOC107876749 [Capsicum annuum]